MKYKLLSSMTATPETAKATEARIKDTLAIPYIGELRDHKAHLMCEYFATLANHLKFMNYTQYHDIKLDIEETEDGLLFHILFVGDGRTPSKGITLDMRTAGTLKSALGILLEPFNH